MGRKARPVALKLVEGNASKESEKKLAAAAAAEAQLPPPKTITPPKGLKGAGKDLWVRLAPALLQQGLLKEQDTNLFMMLCEAWGRYREYEALCTKVGAADAIKLRYRRAADQAFKRYHLLSSEFGGLSPSSRASGRGRVQPTDPTPTNTPADQAKAKANAFFRRGKA